MHDPELVPCLHEYEAKERFLDRICMLLEQGASIHIRPNGAGNKVMVGIEGWQGQDGDAECHLLMGSEKDPMLPPRREWVRTTEWALARVIGQVDEKIMERGW